MKIFEQFNQQLMIGDLKKVDIEILNRFRVNGFDSISPIFKKYDLNIDNLYLNEKSISPEVLYIDNIVSSEIYLDLEILENEFLGLPKIKKKINTFNEMFKNEEYTLLFHPDYNKLALYHFLKMYKKINVEKVYGIFFTCYQAISYGFNKIPNEVFQYIFQFSPSSIDILNRLILNKEIPSESSIDDYITIYRGQGIKSNSLEKAISWTTSLNVANKFASYGEGIVYKAQIKIKNIIEYLDSSEHELWVNFNNLKDLEVINE